jgi:hypothetical protein
MASLREVQESFAAALRNPSVACAVLPPANLAIYRNNTHITWRVTLERTYPVVRRRVGDDYFRQLCAHYRERFPSRSGDLHWYGRDFAGFLDSHLEADYLWLGDLARLEWSRAECSVADEREAIGPEALAQFPVAQLEQLVFEFQPSLRLHSSSFPIFTVWENNQADNAPPADQSIGSEYGLVRIRHESPELLRLEPGLFSFLSALSAGSSLGEAMTRVEFDGRALTDALAFLFRAGLVCSLSLRE